MRINHQITVNIDCSFFNIYAAQHNHTQRKIHNNNRAKKSHCYDEWTKWTQKYIVEDLICTLR